MEAQSFVAGSQLLGGSDSFNPPGVLSEYFKRAIPVDYKLLNITTIRETSHAGGLVQREMEVNQIREGVKTGATGPPVEIAQAKVLLTEAESAAVHQQIAAERMMTE